MSASISQNPWALLSDSQRQQQRQLLMDMLPYYQKIAVYDPDKVFIEANMESCLRIALAGKAVMKQHAADVKPEDAIFSDELFRAYIGEAWTSFFDREDQLFLNAHLTEAAECFRMGFMLADLPEM